MSFIKAKNEPLGSAISSQALVRQKSMLKTSPPSLTSSNKPIEAKYDCDLNVAFLENEADEEGKQEDELYNQLKAKLQSCQLSLMADSSLGDDLVPKTSNKSNRGSMKGNFLIVSRQGTVRGSLNRVKTSLNEIFKEPKITNPVQNAQLNNTNYEQLVRGYNPKTKEDANTSVVAVSSASSKNEKFSTTHYFLAVCFLIIVIGSFSALS